MAESEADQDERFFGCPKHGPVTNHANHCWCGYEPHWWVPEDNVRRLSGAAAGLAQAVNRYVGRSRRAPFSERSLNLALGAYRKALGGERVP